MLVVLTLDARSRLRGSPRHLAELVLYGRSSCIASTQVGFVQMLGLSVVLFCIYILKSFHRFGGHVGPGQRSLFCLFPPAEGLQVFTGID